jgi:hypothetical protein
MSLPSAPPVARNTRTKLKRKRAPRERRPHKNDFNFPLSFPKWGTPATHTTVFAFAMAWHRPRDRIRLQSLMYMRPGTKVITVSDCKHSQGNMEHMCSHFHLPNALKDIAGRIKSERLAAPPGLKIKLYLDYYWLQGRYYRLRYGLNWLKKDAYKLLSAGADEMVLPFDAGSINGPGGSDMRDMMAGVVHPDIKIAFTCLKDNLLWEASATEEIRETVEKMDKGCNSLQTKNWLHPETPFVTISLRR